MKIKGNTNEVIKKYRKLRGISAVELAEKLDVSAGTISHFETGRRTPPPNKLLEIIKILEIPEEEIILDELEDEIENKKILSGTEISFSLAKVSRVTIKITNEIAVRKENIDKYDDYEVYSLFSFESPVIVETIKEYLRDEELGKRILENLNKKSRKFHYDKVEPQED
ncbi:helix-turn-helix transcriptional regulator [Schinkia azotoformans]|uniref:helix-turn-helix domain-containing protein n=1 Tax=Schinkia azotoformans TaxID=1454 RepID=UPI002E1FABBF|nr:helix-turn-helix transcriptional regulator [Schinkia azotoformans]